MLFTIHQVRQMINLCHIEDSPEELTIKLDYLMDY